MRLIITLLAALWLSLIMLATVLAATLNGGKITVTVDDFGIIETVLDIMFVTLTTIGLIWETRRYIR